MDDRESVALFGSELTALVPLLRRPSLVRSRAAALLASRNLSAMSRK